MKTKKNRLVGKNVSFQAQGEIVTKYHHWHQKHHMIDKKVALNIDVHQKVAASLFLFI